jgi:hypothetical protein
MRPFKLPDIGFPGEYAELLFIAWVQNLAQQRLGLEANGSGSHSNGNTNYNFGRQEGIKFTLNRDPMGYFELKSAEGIAESDIQDVVNDSVDKMKAHDFGSEILYWVDLRCPGFSGGPEAMSNFLRVLADQVIVRGQFRLGSRILVEFKPEIPDGTLEPNTIFTGATDVRVTLSIPGPIESDLTRKIAAGLVEVVSAICAFAMGKPVQQPLMVLPATSTLSEEEVRSAVASLRDAGIPNLPRNNVSLDIFDQLTSLADLDGLVRLKGALLSYHAALHQTNPDAATMLFVSSMEALIVPRPEWRKEKATKRFIYAVGELCPDTVNNLVNHINVEQAFSFKQKGGAAARRRQLLGTIYETRSVPTHQGVGLAGMMMQAASPGSLRVILLSELARDTLLSFLQAPRSYLIGHPMFDKE